ncbi:MAG: protoheme IX farnesyltransferase [Saprospiraceae bacterium]|nr:protoheme IX farnesyltransferase [Saprospiraceae bacterium]
MLLIKTRLSMTVVFTSVLGYLIAAQQQINMLVLLILAVGGFMVTASANAINEVLEKEHDALMKRTQIRPLAAGRMKISEAVLFAGLTCLGGVTLLSMINPVTAVMGMLSFVLYAFVYTPLKRYSTIAVAVGAIPGALPVLIGCTAAEGQFTTLSVGLFAIQFLWQFPHFWSIGFLGFEDYKKAGYKLLPEVDGLIDRNVGLYALLYTLLISPVLFLLYYNGDISQVAMGLNIVLTMLFGTFSYRFYKQCDRQSGLNLMFSSFFYMPLILLISLFI